MKRVRVKPGKGSSTAGFVGGLLFVVIGIFVAIPTFGLFGVIWTAFAGVITAVNGINVFSDKGIASHEIMIDDGEDSRLVSPPFQKKDPAERLETLRDLYDRRLITEEEYEKRRAEILSEL